MSHAITSKVKPLSELPRLLFLSKYARCGASSRYRTYQYLPYLEEAGFDCTVSPLFDEDYLAHKYCEGRARFRDMAAAFTRRLGALLRASRYDLVVIEKEVLPYFPAHPERWLNWLGIRYVVDYDDALFHQYDQHRNKWVRRLLGSKIARVMRGARLVTTGNGYLADYARRAGASRVVIIPTVIDLKRYPKPESRPVNELFTIGWIGSPSTAKYMAQIAPALTEVCARGQGYVRLIGSGEVDLPGVPHEIVHWSEADEVAQLQQLGVGVMPLLDSPWERGKCGFKLIQYMACGLPVVASPVGVNAEIVEEGRNGFLAADHEAWVWALTRLRDDARLRQRLGAAGREKVERQYNLQVTGPRLADLLAEAARPPRDVSVS